MGGQQSDAAALEAVRCGRTETMGSAMWHPGRASACSGDWITERLPFRPTRFRVAAVAAAVRGCCRSDPLPVRPLVVIAICLAIGCAIGRLPIAPRGSSPAAAWWIAGAGAVFGWWWVAKRRSALATTFLCVAVACAGAAWSAARFDLFPDDDLAWSLVEKPTPVAIRGTVLEMPRPLPSPTQDPRRAAAIGPSSEFVVRVEEHRVRSRWRSCSGLAAVVVEGVAPLLPSGSRVTVFGRGLRPSPALNPGEFDFRLRARSQRCLSIVRAGSWDCVRVARDGGWTVSGIVDRLRGAGQEVLAMHVSPRHGPLAAALLLGARESLPRQDADDFLVTGTVHILSISGLHVGLLAFALFRVFRLLPVPRGVTLAAVAICTGLYMVLVQAETPVVRATLLVWIACAGAALSRRPQMTNSLALAAIVVLIWRPADVFSTGAQFSFLSTAVLVAAASALARPRLSDPIDRLIERSRPAAERLVRRGVRRTWEAFLAGAAVWAATAPLVASRFHVVSPVGLVVNVLIAPLVALAMGWGFLCLAIAPLSRPLAGWCGQACDAALSGLSVVVSWAARMPGGHAWLAGPADWWVTGWYLILVAALFLLPSARLRRAGTWAVVALAWLAVGWAAGGMAPAGHVPTAGMRVIAAAMGHGCGITVLTPSGRCLVYDAGRLGAPGAARRALAGVLWSEGRSRIDTLVISHADSDHFNAVPELLERFAVGEMVVPQHFLASSSPAVVDLLERVTGAGVPVRIAVAGEAFAIDAHCRVRVWHPAAEAAGAASAPSAARPARDNEASLVLTVESAGRRLLLTGDIEGDALAGLVASGPESCDLLVAPHHGTRTSLPPDIAAATQPALVLVSGAEAAAWREVRQAYGMTVPAGIDAVLKTGGEGAIAVECAADRLAVARFSSGRWRPLPAATILVRPAPPRQVASATPPRPGAAAD